MVVRLVLAVLRSRCAGFNRPQYEAAAAEVYEDNYRDIRKGSNGSCGTTCTAGPGYDFVTGLGTPRANHLVPFRAGRR